MKEKIVALIENVKNIFAARKKNMGSLAAHKPFIAELAQEESSLDSTKDIIQNLDETKPTFAASGLFYVIEKVVPVLRRWQARLQNIPASHTDVSGHQKATREFLTMKKEMFELIAALNVAAQPALMPAVDEADQVKSIIKMFESNKEKYVSEHPIQEVTQKNSYSNCGMQ